MPHLQLELQTPPPLRQRALLLGARRGEVGLAELLVALAFARLAHRALRNLLVQRRQHALVALHHHGAAALLLGGARGLVRLEVALNDCGVDPALALRHRGRLRLALVLHTHERCHASVRRRYEVCCGVAALCGRQA